MDTKEKAFHNALNTLLRPLVRILLRNGVPFRSFAELLKKVYVDVAFEAFSMENRAPSVSRVSVITGLSRKEVSRVAALPGIDESASAQRYNRAARVISGWVRDGRFNDSSGNPLELPIEGGELSFAEIVRLHSGDVPPRSVLDELVRVGTVEITDAGKVRLKTKAYVPRADKEEKLAILGTDVADLISTIDHNLADGGSDPRFQRKVSYDNLPVEVIPRLRRLAEKHAQELLELLDGKFSEQDRDNNMEVNGTGRMKVGVGVYYFEENVFDERGEEDQEVRDE
jgi:hypothetical protein